jgi:hypothetical protein
MVEETSLRDMWVFSDVGVLVFLDGKRMERGWISGRGNSGPYVYADIQCGRTY